MNITCASSLTLAMTLEKFCVQDHMSTPIDGRLMKLHIPVLIHGDNLASIGQVQ